MYVEPLDHVDDSMAGQSGPRPKAAKKKGGGLLASLFGGGRREEEEAMARASSAPAQEQTTSELPEGVPRSEIKVRCQECDYITGIDDHDGFCPDCGAFYVEPITYVTADSLKAELEAQRMDLDKYKEVEKSFDEMNDAEKLEHLKENVADLWDQIAKDRYVLNEKANECMQCFTAAGTIKSEDQYEVLASMIKQRHQNLEDFEIFHREYKQLLAEFETLHKKLLDAQKAYQEQQAKMQESSVS